jgi:hypothetical protein
LDDQFQAFAPTKYDLQSREKEHAALIVKLHVDNLQVRSMLKDVELTTSSAKLTMRDLKRNPLLAYLVLEIPLYVSSLNHEISSRVPEYAT